MPVPPWRSPVWILAALGVKRARDAKSAILGKLKYVNNADVIGDARGYRGQACRADGARVGARHGADVRPYRVVFLRLSRFCRRRRPAAGVVQVRARASPGAAFLEPPPRPAHPQPP